MAGPAEAQASEQEFDVEAAIADFLADSSRMSLNLPHMTTGQRKLTKKVADRHPELKCESFGFGQERQLHIFKRQGTEAQAVAPVAAVTGAVIAEDPKAQERSEGTKENVAAPGSGGYRSVSRNEEVAPAADVISVSAASVNVKNTFIDDWIAAEAKGDGESEPLVHRSMPPQLAKRALQVCVDEGPTEDLSSHENTQSQFPATSLNRPSSPASSTRELPQLPQVSPRPPGLEVRNTFIHFEGNSADERVVQSMPHGMFGQCLLAEIQSRKEMTAAANSSLPEQAPPTTEEPSTVPPPAAPVAPPVDMAPFAAAEETVFAPGTEVRIDGLLKLPAFNGLVGTVQSLDEESGRYSILLSSPACGHRWAKVKGANLSRVSLPPPPCFAPTLAPEEGQGLFPPTPMWHDRPYLMQAQ
eukprot:TRINITY_DN1334_c1_g2_i1.p1 TRINITY_DN1334_c1_g2~~TRINITY_DN1334_c1_g2_i1.p1  ORF type:complete len:414 (-),score=60.06 TRINITY_DN1334_c1_g2_i1:120-1361(-)